MTGKVYAVRVTCRGKEMIVPMQAIELLGDLWSVGYVMPSGHHKKYNGFGVIAHRAKEDAERDLTALAQLRGWTPWPTKTPQGCIPLEECEWA